MKMTKEIEEFLNLAITEHMGKAYTDWKLKQKRDAEPDKVEEEYEKVISSLSPEQEEAITKYCDAIFNSGADTEEFFYRLGLKDGMKLKKCMKQILKALDENDSKKTVSVQLAKDDYNKAIEAHESGSHVEVIGEIEDNGKRKKLMTAESFSIID